MKKKTLILSAVVAAQIALIALLQPSFGAAAVILRVILIALLAAELLIGLVWGMGILITAIADKIGVKFASPRIIRICMIGILAILELVSAVIIFYKMPIGGIRELLLTSIYLLLIIEALLILVYALKNKKDKPKAKWRRYTSLAVLCLSAVIVIYLSIATVIGAMVGSDMFCTIVCLGNRKTMPIPYSESWMVGKTAEQIRQKYGEFDGEFIENSYLISKNEAFNDIDNEYLVIKFDENGVCVSTSRESYNNRD